MSVVTFDGWNTQFYGDCLRSDTDSLAHYRTKGSKNGIRRYQTESGEWTPLGLAERRTREGWGERRAARKEARAQRRTEKQAARAAERSARAERLAKFKAANAEAKRRRNPKNLTDEELRNGINRLKMEQEYRDLKRSPVLKTAEGLVKSYMESKAKKVAAENERVRLANETRKAIAEYKKAKASLRESGTNRINALTGSTKLKARGEFLKAKTERSKNTIRGAISSSVGNIIRKQGSRLVKDMDDKSLIMRGGRKVKSIFKQSKASLDKKWKDFCYDTYSKRDKSGFDPDDYDSESRRKLGL